MTFFRNAGLLRSAQRALLFALSTLAGVGFTGGAASLAQPKPEAYFKLVPPDVPSEVLIGETFKFRVRFKNTSTFAGDIGYAPFIDLAINSRGNDNNTGSGPCDGIDFLTAEMVDVNPPLNLTSLNLTQLIGTNPTCITATTPNTVQHPYANVGLVTLPANGWKLVTIGLPFSSFDPSQEDIVVEVTAKVHNYADVDPTYPLEIRTRGGFRLASDTGGPPILQLATTNDVNTWEVQSVTPKVFKIKKEYSGPENEAVAGPNFVNYYPLKYNIIVDIAEGQNIYKLTLTDNLPNQLQYQGNLKVRIYGSPASAAAGCLADYQLNQVPLPATPGGPLEVQFCYPIKGLLQSDQYSDQEVVIEFEFYIPEKVLGAGCDLSPVLVKNDVKATGLWVPLDPRDAPLGTTIPVSSGLTTDDVYAKCLAIQKSVEYLVGLHPVPGDVLKYKLRFQVSDYHTIGKLLVTDVLGDGQALAAPAPTLTVTDQFWTTGPPPNVKRLAMLTPDRRPKLTPRSRDVVSG